MTCRFLKVGHGLFSIAFRHLITMIPIATVQKIITEILPSSSGQSFARDARDLLIECCVEFITLISSEANDISEKEAKKTIAVEHIEKALTELGFQDYVPDVLAVADEFKDQQKVLSLPTPPSSFLRP
jgi:down-regulator of transcription 1